MKDGTLIRCISILGGVALLIALAVTGADGELRAIAFGLLGFGVGTGFGAYLEVKVRAKKDV